MKQKNEGVIMAKNKIQFQKSISIHGFISQLGTEEQCRKRLFDMRWPSGYRCDNCGHDKYCELKARQLFQCNQCHYQGSLTSGTLFSASKLPLNIWFLAIYLITQEKNGISALELSRQLGISYNAAWRMKHKLMQAMKERDDETPLSGYIQLDDVYLGEFCFKFNRRFNLEKMLDPLIYSSIQTTPMPDRLLKLVELGGNQEDL